MTSLEELFGEEYQTPEAKLAIQLAREDQLLLGRLIEIRKARMSQEEIAAIMGVTQATVSAFERLGNDPKMSTIRRYAQALGVMIRHQPDENPAQGGVSEFISHVGSEAILLTDTAAARARAIDANEHARAWPEEAVASVGSDEEVFA